MDCNVCGKARYVREDTLERFVWPILEELRYYKRAEIDGRLRPLSPAVDPEKRRLQLLEKRRRINVSYREFDGMTDAEYREAMERIAHELDALTPAPGPEMRQGLAEPFGWSLRFGENKFGDNAMTLEELRDFFARCLVAIFVEAGDKRTPIRAIAPQPALRLTGSEHLMIEY